MPSPPFRGEREGPRRVSGGEGEVGRAAVRSRSPHLTPTLSAPRGREGDFQFLAYHSQHAREVVYHISVPETDHPVAVAGCVEAALLIRFALNRMLAAV